MGYKPIENYGVIGDLHSVALVGTDGSIDWCCLPQFDSPSVFAALLDEDKGGSFKICGVDGEQTRQLYHPDTNVLMTYFSNKDGVVLLEDFMPVDGANGENGKLHSPKIIRRLTGIRGTRKMWMECSPAFDYARESHQVTRGGSGVWFTSESGKRLGLSLPTECEAKLADGGVTSEFEMHAGQSLCIVAGMLEDGETPMTLTDDMARQQLQGTIDYWKNWLSRCTYRGRWREMVYRSVLTLKLLTFAPTGAIVAAPTCSLPEIIGGSRNWDYRYTWLRDAAFTVYAFIRVGMTSEAEQFMTWIQDRCNEVVAGETPNIMYRLDGGSTIEEEFLDHLSGYKDSKPVRVGNNAQYQLQLDIFGELMDSIYLYNKYGSPISYDLWSSLRPLLDWVAHNWNQPDESIWEVRGGRRQFVFSKLMCWVALDRGLRLADKRSFPANRDLWLRERDAIYEAIMEHGWSESRQSFVQYFGGESVDASNLLMPLVFFMSPTDPRMLKTIDAVIEDLTSDSLVQRYDVKDAAEDGLGGQEEGSFSMCTFWLVEALTRAGRLDEARFTFERMLGYSNHLGLYAEEIGTSGEALGNFPQAFTHLSLISAAFNLDRKLGGGGV
jgi:GH15 family glucan-1,4-alpha-glucosidase